jgi:hypothetical protein
MEPGLPMFGPRWLRLGWVDLLAEVRCAGRQSSQLSCFSNRGPVLASQRPLRQGRSLVNRKQLQVLADRNRLQKLTKAAHPGTQDFGKIRQVPEESGSR